MNNHWLCYTGLDIQSPLHSYSTYPALSLIPKCKYTILPANKVSIFPSIMLPFCCDFALIFLFVHLQLTISSPISHKSRLRKYKKPVLLEKGKKRNARLFFKKYVSKRRGQKNNIESLWGKFSLFFFNLWI